MTAVISADPKQLVEAHKQGQAEAFDEIVRCYYEGLFAHALRRLGDPHAAEDAVQETLMRAYRALHRFNGQYHLRAWLHRILSNVCHDESSRRQRELRVVERVGATAVVEEELGDLAGEELLDRLAIPQREVIEALAALPEPYRRAIVLRYVDELSFQEVAEATGITEGNARARVHRARAALRRTLTSSVAAIAWIVVLLRRAERTVVPDSGGSAVQASIAASHSSPVLARVADSGLLERAASLAGSLGIAASLAVPVGVSHVADRVTEPSPPAAVAMEEPAADSVPTPAPASPSADRATGAPTSAAPGRATASAPATTMAGAPIASASGGQAKDQSQTSTTVATSPAGDGPTTVAPEPGAGAAPAPETPAAEPMRSFVLDSTDLTATRSWRTDLSGTARVTIGEETISGNVTGVLETERENGSGSDSSKAANEDGAGEPDTTSASAAASGEAFTSDLSLRLDDGRVVRITLSGTLTEQPDGSTKASGGGHVVDEVCGAELGTVTLGGVLHIRNAPLASSLSLSLDGVALAEAGASKAACSA